jgi:hypothetical protein
MRLIKFEFEDWRLLQHQDLPATGLVVLFGANSCGKTSVLEAVEELLTRKQRRRFDPAEGPGDPPISGYVWFELDQAHIAGHPEAELHRALKAGEVTETAWAILGAGVSATLRGASAQDVEDFVAAHLADAGNAGTADDRQQLAKALVSSRRFFAGFKSTYLVAVSDALPVRVREAAKRIAASEGSEADELWSMARKVAAGRPAEVTELAKSVFDPATFAMLPTVVVIDTDPVRLGAEVRTAVEEIHDRLWALPANALANSEERGVDEFLICHRREPDGYEADRWLESLRDDAATTTDPTPKAKRRYPLSEWHRVRRSVEIAAETLAARINENLPSFVRGLGHVAIEVLPPSVWHHVNRAGFSGDSVT